MVSNPIQKKVRNSMLLGAVITLLITGAIIAFLLIQLMNAKKEQAKVDSSYVSVYTLNQDVKSGQIITEDMYSLDQVLSQTVPANATATVDTFINYSLTDNEGNRVYTDKEGTFLVKKSEYLEVFKDASTQKYYTYKSNGEIENLDNSTTRKVKEDSFGMFVIQETSDKARLYKEEATDKYYILRVKNNNTSDPVREKEYINIVGTPLIAKIDMNSKTVLTLNMLSQGSLITNDIRKQEYNSIVLPMDLVTGDYIDIRLQLPSGQDFIVISKKMVDIPMVDGMDSIDTIWMQLSEDEILAMSCAIVEAYRINGSKLYATKYTDPGMQEAATPTYPINYETKELILANPNVTEVAMNSLRARYNASLRNDYINKELEKEGNSVDNVTDKMNQSITKTQEEREKYLESLSITVTN